MLMSEKYLSPKKIEQIYGIEAKKIYWWIRERKITYLKIGKSVLIPQAEFERFLKVNTNNPVEESNFELPKKYF